MARQPRFNLIGNAQHVIQRGNNRQATFFAEQDYRHYLDSLQEASQKYECASVVVQENQWMLMERQS